MKKTIAAAAAVLALFSACSVQENMNPKMFIERLAKLDEGLEIDYEKLFIDGNEYSFFAKDENGTGYAFKIKTDADENAIKISVACRDPAARNGFMELIEKTTRVYSPGEDSAEIIKSLFKGDGSDEKFSYRETQRRFYSKAEFDDGIYFEVKNRTLCRESEAGLTLKPNDKAGYK